MVALFQQSGYGADGSSISEEALESYLREHPDLVRTWVEYSEDQRCSPAWYLVAPGAGLDGQTGWRVGYYAIHHRLPERVFPDEFAACAFFIMREVEVLSKLAG